MFGITLGILAHLVETVSEMEFVVFLSIKMYHCLGGFGISGFSLFSEWEKLVPESRGPWNKS